MSHEEDKPRKKSKLLRLLTRLILKIVFSPIIVFAAGYLYFDGDIRKAVLASLYVYTALTALSIITKFFGVIASAATLNPFKAIVKSFEIVLMLIFLAIYWFAYSLRYSGDFSF